MKKTIGYVIGSAYSGSSLLNICLDAQPRVRGLGEAVNLYAGNTAAHCNLCAKPICDCPVYQAVDSTRFYASLFDYYADCDLLIDSSKSSTACFATHPFEPEFDHKVCLLSKAPHEFAHSWVGHHPEQSVDAAFEVYISYYSMQLELMSWGQWLKPWQSLRVTYRQLTTRTESVLLQLAGFLGFSSPVAPSWETTTHVVGGNWMVAAQTRAQRNLFTEGHLYLGGKYNHRFRTVFYDGHWRGDRPFVGECLGIYRQRSSELVPLLRVLGQPDLRQQMDDVGASPA